MHFLSAFFFFRLIITLAVMHVSEFQLIEILTHFTMQIEKVIDSNRRKFCGAFKIYDYLYRKVQEILCRLVMDTFILLGLVNDTKQKKITKDTYSACYR